MARSAELSGAVGLAAGLVTIAAAGPSTTVELARGIRVALATAAAGEAPPPALLCDSALALARVAAPFLLVPAIAAGALAALQTGGFVGLDPLRPRLGRLDPLEGLRRLASWGALQRAGLGLAKCAIVGALLWGWLTEHARTLGELPRLGAPALWRSVPLGALAVRILLAALAFGALDLWAARRRHLRAQLMTRDEVRRESKEDEGDPQHRAERQRLHHALVEAGPVSKATVVVVNPTHLAVALLHRRDRDEPPRVLAKGSGDGAARIRSAARRAGVPIYRDVALARALHRLGEAGEEIPVALYEAAAAVLIHVYGPAGET